MVCNKLIPPEEMACPGEPVGGGVLAATGFRASGVAAGFRAATPDRLDTALVCCDGDASAAGVFTRNRFCAAPVVVDRERLANGRARAIILNSGVANAATGEPGIANARQTGDDLAKALGCDADDVLVASTGVIGVPLPMDVMERGIRLSVAALGDDAAHDEAAARAIMTTDTVSKRCAVRYEDAEAGVTYTVGGMCKGAGMIAPNMATMLAVITTDAPVAPAALQACLARAAQGSFNHVIVDGDTSTNDTCVALASGAAGGAEISEATPGRLAAFGRALAWVCDGLARKIAADGEGATRLVRVCVMGAATDEDARVASRTVASSPLVKTAIAGHDANWGRIAAALGRSGASFDQETVAIDIAGIPVLRTGLPIPFDEDEALRRFEEPQVDIVCDLGSGTSSYVTWTCDLTHGYIDINADYRS